MPKSALKILQVSTRDQGGGAERIAWNLFDAYRAQGYPSWLAVGKKLSHDPDVFTIPQQRTLWADFWYSWQQRLEAQKFKGAWRMGQFAAGIAEPRRSMERFWGIEDFHFPGTQHLLNLTPQPPSLIHTHNLHGGYFDLRTLPYLSQQCPFVLTLHDSWMLTGHCSHSFACERWQTGCGHCPDLTIYPAIKRDRTAYNWQCKKDIYAQSQLFIATPSQWLMQRVEKSMLASALVDAKVIHNGVDLSIFCPADKKAIRNLLDLPLEAHILLFVGSRNVFKDYVTLRSTLDQLAALPRERPLILLILGDSSPPEYLDNQVEIRHVAFETDQTTVARYYQAANVYLHASRADTFPNAVIEALACGIPVIGSAVGGIPEQIKSIEPCANLPVYPPTEATGWLVPAGDASAMTRAVQHLLVDENLHFVLGQNALNDARQRFDQADQVQHYLEWYDSILDRYPKDR